MPRDVVSRLAQALFAYQHRQGWRPPAADPGQFLDRVLEQCVRPVLGNSRPADEIEQLLAEVRAALWHSRMVVRPEQAGRFIHGVLHLALAKQLAQQPRTVAAAVPDADAIWEQAAKPELERTAAEGGRGELWQLSGELALKLGARRQWSPPLPVRIWLPALVGGAVVALAFLIGQQALDIAAPEQSPTFTAAVSELLAAHAVSEDERRAIEFLLEGQVPLGEEADAALNSPVVTEFYRLLQQHRPSAAEVAAVTEQLRYGSAVEGAASAGAAGPREAR